MLFSLLLSVLNLALGIAAIGNKSLRDMMKIRNNSYVIMTADGKIGRRFIFRDGKYSSDKVLTDYDMAFVFKDASTGFKTLALSGDTQEDINNWKLKIRGDENHMLWFGVVMQMALGAIKR